MKIEILGTGCPRCKNLEANVRMALEKTGKKAEIVKVADIQDKYGIGNILAAILGYQRLSAPAPLSRCSWGSYAQVFLWG